jgi:hypothetical protein
LGGSVAALAPVSPLPLPLRHCRRHPPLPLCASATATATARTIGSGSDTGSGSGRVAVARESVENEIVEINQEKAKKKKSGFVSSFFFPNSVISDICSIRPIPIRFCCFFSSKTASGTNFFGNIPQN